MSILKNRHLETTNNTSSNTGATKPQTIEELNKLFDTVGTADKQLRTTARQHRRLKDRLDDLSNANIDSRALRRTSDELDDIDPANLKSRLSALRSEIEDAIDAPGNIDANKLSSFRRRAAGLQSDLSDIQDTVQDAEDTIQAAENKADDKAADAGTQPQDDSDAAPTTDEQLSARMWALSMLSEYRAAGCPQLKTAAGKEIIFALPIPRPSGTTKYVRMDPRSPDNKDDLPDLVPGVMEKKMFVPITDETGARAKALVMLVSSGKLW